jgi:hypothetical protein
VSKVSVEMSVRAAAAVRQALFESQKGYTNSPACPERVLEIRQVIIDLDDSISSVVETP